MLRRLVVVSSSECFEGEIALINGLFATGMEVFHLRKPGISVEAHEDLLGGIIPAFRDKVVLHQFHECGAALGIRRFHFSEQARRGYGLIKEVRKSFGNEATYSTSIHSLACIEEISGFAYAFFGPVYDSITKVGYRGMDMTGFRLPAHLADKLVAIGGITTDNILKVFEMGFQQAAVLGALWKEPDLAIDKFVELKRQCK